MTPSLKRWNGSAFVDAAPKRWNGSAFVDPASAWIWNGTQFVKVWPPITPVAFDAVGGGGSIAGTSGPVTWSHTAAGPVLAFIGHANNANNSNLTVVYGAGSATPQNMTRLGTPLLYVSLFGYFYWVSVFGLLNPAGGAKTVSITPPVASYVKANTVSYTGVSSFGTPVTKVGSGAPTQDNVVSAPNRRVAQMFHNASSGTPFSNYTQTQRWNMIGGNWSVAMLIGDAPGSGDVDFAAAWGGGTDPTYGAVAVDLIP